MPDCRSFDSRCLSPAQSFPSSIFPSCPIVLPELSRVPLLFAMQPARPTRSPRRREPPSRTANVRCLFCYLRVDLVLRSGSDDRAILGAPLCADISADYSAVRFVPSGCFQARRVTTDSAEVRLAPPRSYRLQLCSSILTYPFHCSFSFVLPLLLCAAACTACSPNTFQPGLGQTTCMNCPVPKTHSFCAWLCLTSVACSSGLLPPAVMLLLLRRLASKRCDAMSAFAN